MEIDTTKQVKNHKQFVFRHIRMSLKHRDGGKGDLSRRKQQRGIRMKRNESNQIDALSLKLDNVGNNVGRHFVGFDLRFRSGIFLVPRKQIQIDNEKFRNSTNTISNPSSVL
jgi:hypothetical protein